MAVSALASTDQYPASTHTRLRQLQSGGSTQQQKELYNAFSLWWYRHQSKELVTPHEATAKLTPAGWLLGLLMSVLTAVSLD